MYYRAIFIFDSVLRILWLSWDSCVCPDSFLIHWCWIPGWYQTVSLPKIYCGLWVLLSCSWYVLVLTAHWPENTHCKPEKKIIFICPWLFFLLVVRIKWNNVRGSTLYTVSYQCKMLRCVVISLIISLFRMEFPMHYYS